MSEEREVFRNFAQNGGILIHLTPEQATRMREVFKTTEPETGARGVGKGTGAGTEMTAQPGNSCGGAIFYCGSSG